MSYSCGASANSGGARRFKQPLTLTGDIAAAFALLIAGSAIAGSNDLSHAARSMMVVSIESDKDIVVQLGNGTASTGPKSCPQPGSTTTSDLPVVIKATPDIEYETFLGVTDWLSDCGYQTLRVNLSTDPNGQPEMVDVNVGFSTAFTCRTGACPKAPEFISIQGDSEIFISEGRARIKPTTVDRLGADLPIAMGSKLSNAELLYIRADREVKYRRFLALLKTLRSDGYHRLAVIPEHYEERPPLLPPLLLVGSRQPTTIVNPDWEQKPSGNEAAQYYPELAQRTGIEGRATVSCLVQADGSLNDCELVSEEPAGQSFGQAALKMVGLFKMKPATVGRQPIAGARVNIPINFRVPKATPPTAGPKPQ